MEDEENQWSFFIRPGTTCFATIPAPGPQKMKKMTLVLNIKMRVGGIATRFKGYAVVESEINTIDSHILVTLDCAFAHF